MITSIILKEERKKIVKKKLVLIFKIPIIDFLPITKINNSSKISTYANFGHLMQSVRVGFGFQFDHFEKIITTLLL